MLAWELAGKDITVNAIAPGWVAVETSTLKLKGPEAKAQSLNPVGRIGNPRGIAHVAVYLASNESDYVDGAILDVDGGWLSGQGF